MFSYEGHHLVAQAGFQLVKSGAERCQIVWIGQQGNELEDLPAVVLVGSQRGDEGAGNARPLAAVDHVGEFDEAVPPALDFVLRYRVILVLDQVNRQQLTAPRTELLDRHRSLSPLVPRVGYRAHRSRRRHG